ncbi:MAG: bifunctional enoyl-CoA hydratase/phosphate acetyltransferase, partial [Oscillospiraceae bacterium]
MKHPMGLASFEGLIARASMGTRRRVAVAGAQDPHALEAVLHAAGQGLLDYQLVGDRARICAAATALGIPIDAEQIVGADTDGQAAFEAVRLVREGACNLLMKGGMPTATLLSEVVNRETGIRSGGLLSHVALLELPGYPKLLALTDGGMVVTPDLGQKRMILENAVALLHRLGIERPKVALLAAVETVNPKMSATVDAAALKALAKAGELPGCLVDGPLSFDLMFSPESAAIKGFCSPVTGDADLLLVPDMTAGNLLCKAMIYTAHAQMAGVIVGALAPIVLVSRGATAEEKYFSLALAAAGAAV